MNILLLYGFHREENEFGKIVVEPFFKRETYSVYEMKNSVSNSDISDIKACNEINELVKELLPDCVIDIHHSEGYINNRIDRKTTERLMKKDNSFIDIYLWSFPLMYFFENPDSDPNLLEFIKKKELGVHFYEFFPNNHIVPTTRTASILSIPYIGLEANINVKESSLVKDSFFDEALATSRKFIDEIDNYYKAKNVLNNL
ncbi:MAG: hypothetical protein AABW92_04135 [Nanoarchaeota archaeon]